DAERYRRYYGHEHPRPDLLGTFAYANPERNRSGLVGQARIAGAGCIATAALIGLAPLFRAGIVARSDVVAEAKVGSSAAGNRPGLSGHHPERSGAVRTYAATRHRHTAELEEHLPGVRLHLTAPAVERDRRLLVTAHDYL